MEFLANSEVETFNFAKNFANSLKVGDFVALFGDLGAGKTMFVKGLCEGLGFGGNVSSPTFTIINEYNIIKRRQLKEELLNDGLLIVHCDMYRIENEADLESVGFFDYLASPNRIIITEWSENIIKFLPQKLYKITINWVDETTRLIKIE